MPPKASSSRSSAAGSTRGRPAAAAASSSGAPGASTAAQSSPGPDSFVAQKLQWALAVPPQRRQPSMQGFIDSCECTTEATELLAAAPLAQLGGPAKLRALLLLLKAHGSFGGRSTGVHGISLDSETVGTAAEQAQHNLRTLVCRTDEWSAHPELQPMFSVAARAALSLMTAGMAISECCRSGGVAGPVPPQHEHALMPQAVAVLERSIGSVSDTGKLGQVLQQQLAGIGGGLLTAGQLEAALQGKLGMTHTWAATPDGAYCGGRVDAQHAAAARAAFEAELRLSDSDASTAGMLSSLSNLLRRIGAAAEAEAALRRSMALGQAAGDSVLEMNAAAGLVGVVTDRDGWRYSEVAELLAIMQRCLKDTKPWLPNPHWARFRERARAAEWVLAEARKAFPATYARQLLPRGRGETHVNTMIPPKVAKKMGDCSGCGGHFYDLKFCSHCRTAKYCSRACQVAHWKAGHKAKCAQLASRSGR